jgi:hypothetical protein
VQAAIQELVYCGVYEAGDHVTFMLVSNLGGIYNYGTLKGGRE